MVASVHGAGAGLPVVCMQVALELDYTFGAGSNRTGLLLSDSLHEDARHSLATK